MTSRQVIKEAVTNSRIIDEINTPQPVRERPFWGVS